MKAGKVLLTIAGEFDERLRRLDWLLVRSYGGLLHKWFRADGYSLLAAFLMLLCLAFMVLTPGYSLLPGLQERAALLFILLFCSFVIVLLGVSYFSETRIVSVQAAGFMGITGGIFILSREGLIDGVVFPHVYLPFMFSLAAVAFFAARGLAGVIYRGVDPIVVTEALVHAELLPSQSGTRKATALDEVSGAILLRSFLCSPLFSPIRLLYLPALMVLLAPARDYLFLFGAIGLVISWLLLAMAELHERLDAMVNLARRTLFLGAPLLLSIIVIAFAICRLADFHYVSNVLESSSRAVVLSYILSAYSCFWLYEYWIGRILSEKLIRLFFSAGIYQVGRVFYALDDTVGNILGGSRVLQLHGGVRLAVVDLETGQSEVFGRTELLETLAQKAVLSDDRRKAMHRQVVEVKRRTQLYYVLLNILLVTLAAVFWMLLAGQAQEAEVTSRGQIVTKPGLVRLADLVFSQTTNEKKPVLLLASSGGGTRAALYAQSVLRGLSTAGYAGDVRLVSGVSGGSVALAYYASHLDALRSEDEGKRLHAWETFSETMAAPYIQDVILHLLEWRVVRGMRLGSLLAESIERRFYPESADRYRRSLGEVESLGIILNSALAGVLLSPPEVLQGRSLSLLEKEHPELTSSEVAGGILAFSNIAESYFNGRKISASLSYVEVRDAEVPLASAAAVSANFPPVFPNAAVDIAGSARYWVTDGGAGDNKGIISLLYALLHALEVEERSRAGEIRPLPPVFVVVADASAFSHSFSQDRGVGAKMAATGQFVDQLARELWHKCEDIYLRLGGQRQDIRLFEIGMPEVLRTRGGLGTHWMLAPSVTVRGDGTEQVVLSGEEVRTVIDSLFQPGSAEEKIADEGRRAEVRRVWKMLEKSETRDVWEELLRALSGQ